MSVLSEVVLRRYPSSESVRVAAAAVLARESKQKDALALLEDVQGREVALTRAQLALDVGNAGQVGLPTSAHHMLCGSESESTQSCNSVSPSGRMKP